MPADTPATEAGRLRLGLVQMTSAASHAPNIAFAETAARRLVGQGAQMIAFPEVAGCMNRRVADMPGIGGEADDPYIAAMRRIARETGVWIHTGSTPVRAREGQLFLNHSNMIDAKGRIVAAYDKIHLFDYFPSDAKPVRESKRYAPGARAVLAPTPWGKVAMTVCYDLRFPALYRQCAQAGAVLLMIPSAFTVATGRAHWEVLLRARAIENGAFVVAAAQTGQHEDGRETYGHSLVVDPWGEVLCDMGEAAGTALVDLELSRVNKARSAIPALMHDRTYVRPVR